MSDIPKTKEDLIEQYLESYSIPNFAQFGRLNADFIADFSLGLTGKALELQEYWRKAYNKVLSQKRPLMSLVTALKQPTGVFTSIHKRVSTLQEVDNVFQQKSIAIMGSYAKTASKTILNMNKRRLNRGLDGSTNEQIRASDTDSKDDNIPGEEGKQSIHKEDVEEDSEEEGEKSIEKEEASEEEDNANNEGAKMIIYTEARKMIMDQRPNKSLLNTLIIKHTEGNITNQLLNAMLKILQKGEYSSDEKEFIKLCVSSTINLVSPIMKQLCKEHNIDIKNTDHLNTELPELDITTRNFIEDLFTKLKEFEDDNDIRRIKKYLDKLQNDEEDISSEKYKVTSILQIIVGNFKAWVDEDDISENTYLRKFEQVLDVLLEDEKIKMKDGERGCKATKNNRLLDDDSTDETSRKVDLLFTMKRENIEVELCNVEFKKQDATVRTKLSQQNKNMRINSCIKNGLKNILRHDTEIITMDWNGREGYMYSIYDYNDCYLGKPIRDLYIPKFLDELYLFKDTLYHLFMWQKYLVKQRNNTNRAMIRHKRKYSQVESISSPVPASPTHHTTIVKIFLTPSKREKFSKDVD